MEDHLDASQLVSARAARSLYFKAIKKAKRNHQSSFLATATPQTVWTVKEFAIGGPPPGLPELPGASTPLTLNKALLDHFFPGAPHAPTASILLPFKESPELVASQGQRVLYAS